MVLWVDLPPVRKNTQEIAVACLEQEHNSTNACVGRKAAGGW